MSSASWRQKRTWRDYRKRIEMMRRSLYGFEIKLFAICVVVGCITGCSPKSSQYTRTIITYPGVIAQFESYPNSPSTEHVHNIEIVDTKSENWSTKLVGVSGQELALSNLTATTVKEWATKQVGYSEVKSDNNSIRKIKLSMDDLWFTFDDDQKLKSLFISGWDGTCAKLTFTSATGSVTWPCSQAELSAILGAPQKTEIEKGEFRHP